MPRNDDFGPDRDGSAAIGDKNPSGKALAKNTLDRRTHLEARLAHADHRHIGMFLEGNLLIADPKPVLVDAHGTADYRRGLDLTQRLQE